MCASTLETIKCWPMHRPTDRFAIIILLFLFFYLQMLANVRGLQHKMQLIEDKLLNIWIMKHSRVDRNKLNQCFDCIGYQMVYTLNK